MTSVATTIQQLSAIERRNKQYEINSATVAPKLSAQREDSFGTVRTVTLPSPQAVKLTNRLDKKRTGGLHNDTPPTKNNNPLVQSHEGAIKVPPRPRFKINDGQTEQVESILSHFSQSEINQESEGQDFSGTITIGLNRMNNRLHEKLDA